MCDCCLLYVLLGLFVCLFELLFRKKSLFQILIRLVQPREKRIEGERENREREREREREKV